MKKLKKALSLSFLIIFVITFIMSIKYYIYVKSFNINNITKNIQIISSNKYKGRLCGTEENNKAAQYIKQQFINAGIKPLGQDYFESFGVSYPKKISGKSPYLTISDKNNNIIKTFKYNKDYKEDMLNFRANSLSIDNKNCYFPSSKAIYVNSNSNYFLVYVPSQQKLTFRSSFFKDSTASMAVMVTQETYDELKKYIINGYVVKCYIPMEISQSTAYNVIGVIKGRNSELPPIVLSAHFDHVGCDLNGTIYNGALDNASGISYVIEAARYLNKIGRPSRDIIFAAFNGEELGFRGSSNFVVKHKSELKNSKVFNFDMIGGSESAPLCIMAGEKDSVRTSLVRQLSDVCQNKHIYFNYAFKDSSDHSVFRTFGIDAITFCDNDISKIHTPNDKYQYINEETIKRCFEASSPEILISCYTNNLFIIYNKYLILISICGTIAVIVIMNHKIKDNGR